MDGDEYDYVFKILLIGDAGVGKSSMLLRFTEDFFDESISSTIGVDFKVKMMNLHGSRIKVTIWDTAGQERFRTLTSSYYRGAHGIILVYDVSRPNSFEHLNQWLQEIEIYSTAGSDDIIKVLVGNKVDKERSVDRNDAEDWAREHGMMFLETSAKTKKGITHTFREVVEKIYENPTLLQTTSATNQSRGLRPRNDNDSNNNGTCC